MLIIGFWLGESCWEQVASRNGVSLKKSERLEKGCRFHGVKQNSHQINAALRTG